MSRYEQLLAENEHIKIKDTHSLPDGYSGFYKDGIILIDKDLSETRKAEVLYEELAHHKLTYGNILDQSKDINRKFENYARRYGYEAALPLRIIVEAHNYGVSNLYELAEYVQLSEEYIAEILKHYKNKYGIGTHYGEYLITFDPLRVFKYKEI
ncbi:ImmA/IrrE family metallo-endopeptidase [Staphylococcus epidermidis]|uniref:ImmA/IrrE family metallo-endopeptidase n=1 Tax=Staphylococcus epidermidis TaxID=1282 RepID=UPI0018878C41|nr:ImmA/IrrE family metallo-endopeptidase [Staphylococcus epidermidis]MBF2189459.1 ImmA/IrrE family metallo-endopeptidase [Staphylococcus epidermidis]MCG1087189.1 ImmA/IrrE family metallo-endopeptidase [Staphylococcus epidermidis]MCG1501714.1 ImmA/IrrE family metallo-endopeptidase [Staphylococcus epidermidis]MCG2017643.1 ImmA/IrrE family metallo-endopeptidase [Staphylococcus epidermidis]MCG2027623.1 ImmA/IrrE family metallo-endopeptidase [Staphylococcus epidermidis]